MATRGRDLFVHACAVTYYVFVMVLCTLSVTESVIVLYIHNRSTGEEDSLSMKPWVSLSALGAWNEYIMGLLCIIIV